MALWKSTYNEELKEWSGNAAVEFNPNISYGEFLLNLLEIEENNIFQVS